jgi:CheY-like chemotaxis protein
MNVLAVEDDAVAQLVREAELKSLGHEVRLAANGVGAGVAMAAQAARLPAVDAIFRIADAAA